MEKQENKPNVASNFTKETDSAVQLSRHDAEEFRNFKRQKKMAEITNALTNSAVPIYGKDDVKRRLELALRYHQAAVKVLPTRLSVIKPLLLGRKIKMDCVLGGEGETLPKVKAYEGKIAKKLGAEEFTLILAPSQILERKYGEIKREIRRVQWAVRPYKLKVWADKSYPFCVLARLARVVSELGVESFCVPYFSGCQRLRYDLFGKCKLEVSEVETLAEFQQMRGAGVERVVTSRISELYAEWLKEVENQLILSESVE